MMEKRKISTEFYNVVRVLATVMVVVGHSVYYTWSGDSGNIELNIETVSRAYSLLSAYIGQAVGWVYGFHMPLFFMLSGALYTYSKKIHSFQELFKTKAMRLIVPYYLVGTLYMFPVKRISGFYMGKDYFTAFQNFLFGSNAGHLWFLLALFWCFLLFYPIEKYICQKNMCIGIITACVIYNLNGGGGYLKAR